MEKYFIWCRFRPYEKKKKLVNQAFLGRPFLRVGNNSKIKSAYTGSAKSTTTVIFTYNLGFNDGVRVEIRLTLKCGKFQQDVISRSESNSWVPFQRHTCVYRRLNSVCRIGLSNQF